MATINVINNFEPFTEEDVVGVLDVRPSVIDACARGHKYMLIPIFNPSGTLHALSISKIEEE